MKNKSSTKPWSKAQPYLLGAAGKLGSAYDQTAGPLTEMAGQYSGAIGDFALDRLNEGDAGVNAARDYGVSVLGGDFLTQNNPYFDDMLDNALNRSTNATQAALGRRGLTGGSDYAGIIADRNAQVATNLAYNDYGRERAAMDNAASRAGSIAAADYLPVGALGSAVGIQGAPLSAASQYASSLGGLFGGTGTNTQRPSTFNSIMDGAGTALSMAALFSDERLKENITKVGKTDGGLGVYTYTYKGDSTPQMGVMAQEVEKKQKKALGPKVGGYRTVRYGEVK